MTTIDLTKPTLTIPLERPGGRTLSICESDDRTAWLIGFHWLSSHEPAHQVSIPKAELATKLRELEGRTP